MGRSGLRSPWAWLPLGLAACARSPSDVCDHEVAVSQTVAMKGCLAELQALQAKDDAAFKAYARCSLDARNEATLVDCKTETRATAAQKLNVTVNAQGATLRGKRLSDAPTLTEVVALLGPPERTLQLVSTSHTWDSLGIHCLEKAGRLLALMSIFAVLPGLQPAPSCRAMGHSRSSGTKGL
jgi:hypothetical protein